MKNKKLFGGLAMLALVIIGIGTLVNFLLQMFGGDISSIIGIVMHIMTVMGLIFVALYAYEWVEASAKSKKGTYKLLYWVSIIVIIVFYVLRLVI